MKYHITTENGTVQKVDTENLVELCGDERWHGGHPMYYWMTKSGKRFFVERQANWQGETYSIEETTREQMIALLANPWHPSKAAAGLEIMGEDKEIEEVS